MGIEELAVEIADGVYALSSYLGPVNLPVGSFWKIMSST